MSDIPTGRAWKTQDGRVLDIHWMDTLHLIRTFNMLIRNNHMDRRRAEQIGSLANAHFVTMREEIKNRGAYSWTREWHDGESFEQVHTNGAHREDIKTLCMMRAMLDTNVFWPHKKQPSIAISNLREKGQLVIDVIHTYSRDRPHPDWHKLLAKFTEYRLERS